MNSDSGPTAVLMAAAAIPIFTVMIGYTIFTGFKS
jgi:hypothetical protein